MPGAFLTIVGMYNYDSSIFDNFQVPDGVDRELAINSIFLDCGNRGLLYIDFDFMKMMIGVWSARNLRGWDRAYKAMLAEYNPIHNYDRIEEWEDSAESESHSENSETANMSGANSSTSFDSYTGRETDSSHSDSESDGTSDGTGKVNSTHKGRLTGNIGVTTSQQMVTAELDLAKRLDIYSIISESFAEKFCYAW